MGATLTPAGQIAGIVLTVGTAVDANVIIFERIREELRRAKRPFRAIEDGFPRSDERDHGRQRHQLHRGCGDVQSGLGPVKGFAVTLTIGPGHLGLHGDLLTRLMILIWWNGASPSS